MTAFKTIGSTAASHDKLPERQYSNEKIRQFQLPEIVDSTLLIYKAKKYDKKKEGIVTGEPGFRIYFFLFDFAQAHQGIVKVIPGWTFAGGSKFITQLATLTDEDYPLVGQLGKVGEFTPKDKTEPVAIRALVDIDEVDVEPLQSFYSMYPSVAQLDALASMIAIAGLDHQLVPVKVGQ